MLARIRKTQEENEGGFTLIELLVVIIIIGILAAIAIPTFLNQRVKGWESAAKSELKNAATAQESYFTDNSTYVDRQDPASSCGRGLQRAPDVDPDDRCTLDGGDHVCMTAVHRPGGEDYAYGSASGAPIRAAPARPPAP
jgi:prepilin-type N-terminal cleavage/methylation domain-containing protein